MHYYGNAHMPRTKRTSYNPSRRVTSLTELGELLELHRHTVTKRIAEYGTVDLHDFFEVIYFLIWHREEYGTPYPPYEAKNK